MIKLVYQAIRTLSEGGVPDGDPNVFALEPASRFTEGMEIYSPI